MTTAFDLYDFSCLKITFQYTCTGKRINSIHQPCYAAGSASPVSRAPSRLVHVLQTFIVGIRGTSPFWIYSTWYTHKNYVCLNSMFNLVKLTLLQCWQIMTRADHGLSASRKVNQGQRPKGQNLHRSQSGTLGRQFANDSLHQK